MISESLDFRAAAMQGRLNFLNLGSGVASIQVFGTTRPASGAAAGGAALVEIDLDDPAGELVGATLVLTATADALIAQTGVAAWARVVNGNGDFAFDCDVTVAGGAGEVQLSQVILYAGGLVRLLSAVLG